MKKFRVSPGAADDLEEIWEYVAEDNLDAADRLIDLLYSELLKLVEDPGLGHRRTDLAKSRPILFWPVGNYLILYRTDGGLVEVVAFAHGKRDIPVLLRRRRL